MAYEFYPKEIQDLLEFDNNKYGKTTNRLDVSVAELEIVYAENFPYTEIRTTNGIKYIWTESFLNKCLIAFSTDSLAEMNAQELAIWYDYVAFSDEKSTSATTEMLNGDAIGCTNPDENGKSYAIYSDYSVSSVECIDAIDNYPRETIMKSLDTVFIDMLNCDPFNTDDTIVGELENVSPCAT